MNLAVFFFGFVIASIMLYAMFGDVNALKVYKVAKKTVRKNLLLKKKSIEEILQISQVPIQFHQQAIFLIHSMAKIISVPPESICFFEKFKEILCLSVFDLAIDEKCRQKYIESFHWEFVEVFECELIFLVKKSIGRSNFSKVWDDCSSLGFSDLYEDEPWLSFIYSMNVFEFLYYFSPLIPVEKASKV